MTFTIDCYYISRKAHSFI